MSLSQTFKGDIYNPEPKHFNGTVVTAGTPITITSPGGDDDPFVLIFVRNPSRGPNANASANAVLLINVDGGPEVLSLNRGESIYIPGNFEEFTVDATMNNIHFECIGWH